MQRAIPYAQIDKTWTLFLDRDGVINQEIIGEYINHRDNFKFMDGVLEAIPIFNTFFGLTVVVTNQRGVAKGLTPLAELNQIHKILQQSVADNGGKIDKVFFCAESDLDHHNRKPNPGMAELAKKTFPQINFHRSIMIGNSISDMGFGRNIGAYTIFLPTNRPEVDLNDDRIDAVFATLLTFAMNLTATKF